MAPAMPSTSLAEAATAGAADETTVRASRRGACQQARLRFPGPTRHARAAPALHLSHPSPRARKRPSNAQQIFDAIIRLTCY
ncbi:hypothetical protein OF001_U160083 [Pseudomonas sp. OF001]|nr:hypothetical protein OF001_U160083 [Pseudomonas sp. OF001]